MAHRGADRAVKSGVALDGVEAATAAAAVLPRHERAQLQQQHHQRQDLHSNLFSQSTKGSLSSPTAAAGAPATPPVFAAKQDDSASPMDVTPHGGGWGGGGGRNREGVVMSTSASTTPTIHSRQAGNVTRSPSALLRAEMAKMRRMAAAVAVTTASRDTRRRAKDAADGVDSDCSSRACGGRRSSDGAAGFITPPHHSGAASPATSSFSGGGGVFALSCSSSSGHSSDCGKGNDGAGGGRLPSWSTPARAIFSYEAPEMRQPQLPPHHQQQLEQGGWLLSDQQHPEPRASLLSLELALAAARAMPGGRWMIGGEGPARGGGDEVGGLEGQHRHYGTTSPEGDAPPAMAAPSFLETQQNRSLVGLPSSSSSSERQQPIELPVFPPPQLPHASLPAHTTPHREVSSSLSSSRPPAAPHHPAVMPCQPYWLSQSASTGGNSDLGRARTSPLLPYQSPQQRGGALCDPLHEGEGGGELFLPGDDTIMLSASLEQPRPPVSQIQASRLSHYRPRGAAPERAKDAVPLVSSPAGPPGERLSALAMERDDEGRGRGGGERMSPGNGALWVSACRASSSSSSSSTWRSSSSSAVGWRAPDSRFQEQEEAAARFQRRQQQQQGMLGRVSIGVLEKGGSIPLEEGSQQNNEGARGGDGDGSAGRYSATLAGGGCCVGDNDGPSADKLNTTATSRGSVHRTRSNASVTEMLENVAVPYRKGYTAEWVLHDVQTKEGGGGSEWRGGSAGGSNGGFRTTTRMKTYCLRWVTCFWVVVWWSLKKERFRGRERGAQREMWPDCWSVHACASAWMSVCSCEWMWGCLCGYVYESFCTCVCVCACVFVSNSVSEHQSV